MVQAVDIEPVDLKHETSMDQIIEQYSRYRISLMSSQHLLMSQLTTLIASVEAGSLQHACSHFPCGRILCCNAS